jgi:hypothetical protein
VTKFHALIPSLIECTADFRISVIHDGGCCHREFLIIALI